MCQEIQVLTSLAHGNADIVTLYQRKKHTDTHEQYACTHSLDHRRIHISFRIYSLYQLGFFSLFEHAYINLVARCWNLYTYSQLQSRCPFRIHIIFQVFPFLALIRVFFKHALMWDAWHKDWAWMSVARCDIYTICKVVWDRWSAQTPDEQEYR